MKRHGWWLTLTLIMSGCGAKSDDKSLNDQGAAEPSDVPATTAVPAGGKDQPILRSKPIEVGMTQTYKAISFDIPKNWRANAQGDVLVLVPQGANSSGEAEEIYLLASRNDVHVLDGAAADQTIEQAVAQLQR